MKVLVVDDSALMRRCLREILEAEVGVEVRTARNGRDALDIMAEFQPDVVTLDVNMPEMDGLTCLGRIMVERPCPVVMVSSLTEEGAAVTLEALELGAVDYIPKPDGTVSLHINKIRRELVSKVLAASTARIRRARGLSARMRMQRSEDERKHAARARARTARREDVPGLVLIGVSTGGPRTLEEILPLLPADLPWPVLVAQHMPASFTAPFARRINGLRAHEVVEVAGPTPLAPGHIYIGRGDNDLVVEKRFSRPIATCAAPDGTPWHPSVERMVASAREHFAPESLVGVLLTGMGNDGARAMAALRHAGGRTIAEAEETAVVFGMPNELIKANGADVVLPCHHVARQIIDWLG